MPDKKWSMSTSTYFHVLKEAPDLFENILNMVKERCKK
jgi:hypothetical protein